VARIYRSVRARDRRRRNGGLSGLALERQLEYIVTFNGWVAAKVADHQSVAALYQRRFRPDYAPWRRRDAALRRRPKVAQQSDDYVRVTVFLATALFLTALSRRFDFAGPRAVIVGIAAILLFVSLFWILKLSRA
jgi:hypothetical protein